MYNEIQKEIARDAEFARKLTEDLEKPKTKVYVSRKKRKGFVAKENPTQESDVIDPKELLRIRKEEETEALREEHKLRLDALEITVNNNEIPEYDISWRYLSVEDRQRLKKLKAKIKNLEKEGVLTAAVAVSQSERDNISFAVPVSVLPPVQVSSLTQGTASQDEVPVSEAIPEAVTVVLSEDIPSEDDISQLARSAGNLSHHLDILSHVSNLPAKQVNLQSYASVFKKTF
ncbi:hypothetical protein OROHE_019592 [Orobanche hederae]